MGASPDDRKTVLMHLASVLGTLHDGAPYADNPAGDPWPFVLKEAARAPASEFETLVDLLENPPTEEELRAGGAWGIFDIAVSQYAGAYAFRRPEDFAPVAERLVRDPQIGWAVLEAIGDVRYERTFDATPYLDALEKAMTPPYDEDRVFSLIGGLGQANSTRGLRLLERLGDECPAEFVDERRWIREAIERVSARIKTGES